MFQKQSEAFHTFLWHFFPSLKQNFITYYSSKVFSCPDCIFEIQQLWQSGFSRVYSNSCWSCSFAAEIIKIGQSSYKIYSNNSEFSRVYNNFKCLYKKKSGNLLNAPCISVDSIDISKVGDLSQGWPKGFLFNSYYIEV